MDTKLKDKIHAALETLKEGWCWPEKAEALAWLVLEMIPTLVVEIGVFGGRSLVPQALAMQHIQSGIVVGIDSWRAEQSIEGALNGANDDWWRTLDLNKIHNDFIDALWALGLQERCLVIRSGAEAAVQLFRRSSIDILHIDGNHSELVSCRDVAAWLPKVKPQGHVWLDDSNWPSMAKAVELMEKECRKVKDISAPERLCTLYQKNG